MPQRRSSLFKSRDALVMTGEKRFDAFQTPVHRFETADDGFCDDGIDAGEERGICADDGRDGLPDLRVFQSGISCRMVSR